MADPARPVQPPSGSPDELKRRYREFLDLLPLTLALAGLPHSDSGRYYTEEQIETRAFTVKNAWKLARQTTRDCLQK